jgi:hypothetical protein
MWRVDFGFLLCALALPLFLLVAGDFDPGAVVLAAMATGFTVTGTALVGLPLYIWCREHRCLTLWPFLAGGVVGGAALALPFGPMLGGWEGIKFLSTYFALIGAIHATLFWLVAIFRNAALLKLAPAAADA